MDRGAAGEPTAKRAKKDKEDPLVRRRKELVLLDASARAEGERRGKELVREAKLEAKRLKQEAKDTFRGDLRAVCAELEAKNEKNFGGRRLPPEVWKKIIDDENVQQNDVIALASTCRFFRDTTKDLGKKVETDLKYYSLLDLRKSGKMPSHTLGWFQWVCDTFKFQSGFKWSFYSERVRGAVYEGDLLNYAAFQGSVEILRWLMEEKGCESNWQTGRRAGLGGSVEVLDYLGERGYEFDEDACAGAARGGRLKALKYLRGLDPPCPWDEGTCEWAAEGGHLEILKFARGQDPPCPWHRGTCANAARAGHLDVLKWARSQDPPCPWYEGTCTNAAEEGHLDILKWARSQDPPCPWDERTCEEAARGGNLEVLKFLRSQDPPCPWNEETCAGAAGGGHLEVLKWLRGQDPPCPWRRRTCRKIALENGHQHIVDWIDQQEDESDADAEGTEYSDWEVFG
ncbi:putative ankyrin repeat protein [Chloropicon roscoffensis]|uniref:Ankyrin repeat protein n=1 Tax=Chloropicon roscoffensis TaxID=1461544 RepID=A0AAX4PJL9_9CHLO